MSAEGDETFVQRAGALAAALFCLEVDVRLPEHLGHRERLLRRAELEDRAGTFEVLQLRLELRVLDPSGRVARVELSIVSRGRQHGPDQHLPQCTSRRASEHGQTRAAKGALEQPNRMLFDR